MKSRNSLRACLSVLVLLPFLAGAQTNIFSVNVVGYVNFTFRPGATLFGNPLETLNNSLSSLIQTAPEGASVSAWDVSSRTFSQVATFSGGAWSSDFMLNPGQGFSLNTPMGFTNTFVGTVLMPDGSPNFQEPIPPPPPFEGANGMYLRSCVTPMALAGDRVFTYIFGRLAQPGEQVMTLDTETQLWRTTTFLAEGFWDNGDPSLRVGEAAYFNIGAEVAEFGPALVPEPSSLVLTAFLGAAVLLRRLKAKRA